MLPEIAGFVSCIRFGAGAIVVVAIKYTVAVATGYTGNAGPACGRAIIIAGYRAIAVLIAKIGGRNIVVFADGIAYAGILNQFLSFQYPTQ